MKRPATGVALGLGILAAAASGCGSRELEPDPRPTPAAAALELFRAAALDTDAERLAPFGLAPGDSRAASLGDALDALRGVEPRVVSVRRLGQPDTAFIDVEGALPHGGEAVFLVLATVEDEGSWRVTGFHGPGIDWPARSSNGDGLTVSAPPE